MTNRKSAKSVARVLVADDHGVTRFGLVQFLRDKLDAETTHEAQRFDDALALLRSHTVDLAIFDLDIPGLADPADLAQVRETWPAVKVVVLSGSSERGDILSALTAGVHGYIVKTETMEGLAERLGYVLSGEVYVPPCLSELSERGRKPGSERAGMDDAVEPAGDAANALKLTTRQRQVLEAIMRGQSNKQIAKDLDLAVGTVKMHVSAVLTALGAQNRLHAASLGRRLGA
jgi:DNA-binding NarL/FixJ family response regulator